MQGRDSGRDPVDDEDMKLDFADVQLEFVEHREFSANTKAEIARPADERKKGNSATGVAGGEGELEFTHIRKIFEEVGRIGANRKFCG
jgi:hypothetical protein